MLTIPKPDGFSDGQNTFQGVRTYDPQAGTWTTPDAYHGDVHDPMSQKPYMWNRNNPYAYEDPSGYVGEELRALSGRLIIILAKSVGRTSYTAEERAWAKGVLNVPSNAPKIAEANVSHMFRVAAGHVPDSALNRAILQSTASDAKNLIATKSLREGGTLETYERTLPSGATAWAEVRVTTDASGATTREITNGGINPK